MQGEPPGGERQSVGKAFNSPATAGVLAPRTHVGDGGSALPNCQKSTKVTRVNSGASQTRLRPTHCCAVLSEFLISFSEPGFLCS